MIRWKARETRRIRKIVVCPVSVGGAVGSARGWGPARGGRVGGGGYRTVLGSLGGELATVHTPGTHPGLQFVSGEWRGGTQCTQRAFDLAGL